MERGATGTAHILTFRSETEDFFDPYSQYYRRPGEAEDIPVSLHLFVQAQDAADGAADAAPLYYQDSTLWHSDYEPHLLTRPVVLRRRGGAAVLTFDDSNNTTGCDPLCRALDLLHWEPAVKRDVVATNAVA
jgi:hypothetical protein